MRMLYVFHLYILLFYVWIFLKISRICEWIELNSGSTIYTPCIIILFDVEWFFI